MARTVGTKIVGVEEMYKLFNEYVKITKDNPILVHDFKGKEIEEVFIKKEKPITMEGLYNYIYDKKGIDVEHYFTNSYGNYDDYLEVCKRIKSKVREDHINGGMAGIYNPSITQRLNGLVDKTETEAKVTSKVIVGLPEDEEEDS